MNGKFGLDFKRNNMKCKDCKYFHIKDPTGYSKAFCGHWESEVGEIKSVIRKCKYYVKKEEL